MIEINVPKSNDGYVYTIKCVEVNYLLQCPKKCFYQEHKDEYVCDSLKEIPKLGIEYDDGIICCTKVVINVKNTGSNNDWVVGAEDICMVDSEGFSYNGIILCDEMVSLRIAKNGTRILPGTQLNYVQLFPQLPNNVQISKFKVNIHHLIFTFNVSEIDNKVDLITNESQKTDTSQPITDKESENPFYTRNIQYEVDNANRIINHIKTDMYSRLNNVLTTAEKTKIENNIRKDIYSLKLEIKGKEETVFKNLINSLNSLENDFAAQLAENKNKELGRKEIEQKIEELFLLSPREFEEYVSQLYASLGYEVELTPYSNDKGVDIVMTLDETKYVVQCKRYKKTVGSPDIQKFIGSIDHFNADKGIFVTTGLFSFEAEKMAAQHPIELVNRVELAKLILKAINSDKNI